MMDIRRKKQPVATSIEERIAAWEKNLPFRVAKLLDEHEAGKAQR